VVCGHLVVWREEWRGVRVGVDVCVCVCVRLHMTTTTCESTQKAEITTTADARW